MGRHAFSDMPGQAAWIQGLHPEIVNEGTFGVSQGWDVPVTLWRAATGFDASYPENTHNTLSFITGGGSIERLDGRFAGRTGNADNDTFMLYTGGSRRYASRSDVRICHLYFQSSLIGEIAASDGAGCRAELRDDRIFARDLILRRFLEQYVARSSDTSCPPCLLEMDARAVLLSVHLLHHHSNRSCPDRPAKGMLSALRLTAAIDHIEAHLAEDVSLADLARTANLSRHHFCTAFRRSTGLTPHRYVTMRRLERAQRLLSGDTPLAEIALLCGFASQQHFTTVFRTALGIPPGVLRASKTTHHTSPFCKRRNNPEYRRS